MFGKKIKITDELYAKLEKAASIAKATNVEELALRILETEADRLIRSSSSKDLSEDEIKSIENQLKGLGYLD